MPASGRSEAEAASRTREGVGGDRREPPTRLGRREVRSRCCAGRDSKGQPGGRSTATQALERGSVSDRARSEPRESSRLGLWRYPPSIRQQPFISKGLGLWRCSSPICQQPFINNHLRLWRCPSPPIGFST
ncbi:hypothetical protein DVK07_05315 [Halorubrum sp. Atlit-26R]|nr:hypothetical protein DVK07_05315 [Halorubrum sp. Atlit-26R]